MRIGRLHVLFAVALLAMLVPARAHAACPGGGTKYKVKIDSAPQGAQIYVGGKECPAVGATPWEGSLPAGTYNVVVEAPGYEQATKQFKVARIRKVQELFMPLTRRPQIEVRADADKGLIGASVWLDGESKGTVSGPLVISTTAGRHLIEIKKEGYETLTQWVDLTSNPSVVLTPTIKENPKPKFGTIVVEADVDKGEVYIDGNKHPDVTPTVINNVIEGVHVIEVRKPPAPPWRQTVTVTANQQTKVSAQLAALMNSGTGVVRVLSDTQGARAFLDGTDMGPVPVDIKDVKAGDHIVQVKAPGFQVGERKVSVSAGQSQIVKVDLNAEAPGDQGTIKIVSTVPEAEVFIDGAAVGKVPQEKKVSSGEHPIVVRLNGYKQFETKVRVEPRQSITVQAELKAVGRLRVLSTPSSANVVVNGVPSGKTPFDSEVEVGETVIRIEMAGFQPFEQTITIEGGKPHTISRELAIAGKSETELQHEQKGLSSFGARVLPRGRSTVDFDAGYPYFLNTRITVGAGRLAKKLGFDATVGVRTMLARSEIGIGGRAMLADANPFSVAIFTNLFWGSKLFDDSQRNGVTFDAGLLASLTALSNVTITGRAYLELWSDRHCPVVKANGMFEGQDPIAVCQEYKDDMISATRRERAEFLTGNSGNDFFGRDAGYRVLISVIAEIAVRQRWSIFGILEGAPFQEERALFTNLFSGSMPATDYILYGRGGFTYKF